MDDDVIRFCRDCRFFSSTDEKCLHEKATSTTAVSKYSQWLVTGEGPQPPEIDHYYASTMRSFGCGKEAKMFEPITVQETA